MNPSELLCPICWSMWGLQFVGILSALIARRSQGILRVSSQHAFFLLLAILGAVAMVALLLETNWWIVSAFTIAGMVVTATYDHREEYRTAVG